MNLKLFIFVLLNPNHKSRTPNNSNLKRFQCVDFHSGPNYSGSHWSMTECSDLSFRVYSILEVVEFNCYNLALLDV